MADKKPRSPLHPNLQPGQGEAIKKLIGRPVAATPAIPETAISQLLALREQVRKQKYPPQNPYKSSFYKFLTTCVYTKDEARGGQVKQFPDYPYIKDLCDDLMTERLQFWEKSRRMLASWLACAADLWVIGGGTDPRWPALALTADNPNGENRQVILAARKLEDIQGSAWFLSERIQFIYDQFEARGFREKYWPDFPTAIFTFNRAKFSNGGRIDAVPQGSDQLRGPGATLIHAEEVATWTALKDSITGALPVLQGGGHFLGIMTANSASYAADICLDRVTPG